MSFKSLFKLNLYVVNLAGYIRTIQYWLTEHYKFNVVKKNNALMDSDNGKTCYICGLGPSLKDVKLSEIKGDTIVVNHFYKMGDNIPEFVPTYYIMYDSGFVLPEYFENLKRALDFYSPKGTKFLLNSKLSKKNLDKYDNVFYISAFKGEFMGQEYRIDKVMPSFDNVVGAAIGVAMGMGYKKIVLLGCDFNSFASPVSNHCYEEKNNVRRIELWYELYRYSIVAYGHESLQKYAQRHNIQIVNSTKGSLIDAYPFEIDEDLYNK